MHCNRPTLSGALPQHTHHGFTKWVVQPATGRFYLVPDAELTHTIRVIASTLEDILPTAHILAANRDNPHTTTVVNHTERPFLRIALAHTVAQHSVQHDHMWLLTHAMIHTPMTHNNWETNHPVTPPPNTNAPTTDTAAAPPDAPTDPGLRPHRCLVQFGEGRGVRLVLSLGPRAAPKPPSDTYSALVLSAPGLRLHQCLVHFGEGRGVRLVLALCPWAAPKRPSGMYSALVLLAPGLRFLHSISTCQ